MHETRMMVRGLLRREMQVCEHRSVGLWPSGLAGLARPVSPGGRRRMMMGPLIRGGG